MLSGAAGSAGAAAAPLACPAERLAARDCAAGAGRIRVVADPRPVARPSAGVQATPAWPPAGVGAVLADSPRAAAVRRLARPSQDGADGSLCPSRRRCAGLDRCGVVSPVSSGAGARGAARCLLHDSAAGGFQTRSRADSFNSWRRPLVAIKEIDPAASAPVSVHSGHPQSNAMDWQHGVERHTFLYSQLAAYPLRNRVYPLPYALDDNLRAYVRHLADTDLANEPLILLAGLPRTRRSNGSGNSSRRAGTGAAMPSSKDSACSFSASPTLLREPTAVMPESAPPTLPRWMQAAVPTLVVAVFVLACLPCCPGDSGWTRRPWPGRPRPAGRSRATASARRAIRRCSATSRRCFTFRGRTWRCGCASPR